MNVTSVAGSNTPALYHGRCAVRMRAHTTACMANSEGACKVVLATHNVPFCRSIHDVRDLSHCLETHIHLVPVNHVLNSKPNYNY